MILALALGCRPQLAEKVTVTESRYVPTALVATFPVGGDGAAEVRVERDGQADRVVAAVVDRGVATARVVGLAAGEKYRLVGVVDGRDHADVDYRAADAPKGLKFDVDGADPDADAASGFVMMTLEGGDYAGVVAVDADGNPVWWVPADDGWTAGSARLTLDGQGVLFVENDVGRVQQEQRLVRIELDGSDRTDYDVHAGHHMVAELDQGEFAWPSWDIREVPWDQGVPSAVLGDKVLVGDGLGEPHTLLSFFDDRGPAYVECSHGLVLDQRLGQSIYEWTHTNSVVWLPERDVLIVTARLLDSILEVDRTTGEVHWQLGGRDQTLKIADPEDYFSHGHMSDAWDGGLLMFDNGSHHRTKVSRVLEYAIDAEARTASVVWEYPDPGGLFVPFLGDARRLPSDDVLVAWGPAGRIEEVTRSKQVRWRLWAPDHATIGRVRFLATLQP